MLELLIKLLQATFQVNSPFQQVYSLAEQVTETDTDKKYPAVYCSKDEYKTFDFTENYMYFRQAGKPRRSDTLDEAVHGCDRLVRVDYPIHCVAYVPKDIYESDNNFIDDKVAQNIANFITLINWNSLAPAMKADQIYAEINDTETDRHALWRREYKGVDMAARLDHVYCSVSFTITVEISESCLANFDCALVDVVINGTTIDISISDSNAWHKSGDAVIAGVKIGTINNFPLPIITNNVIRWTFGTDGHFVPELPSTYDIGSPAFPVRNIYADNITPLVHPPVTIGAPANGLSIVPATQVLTISEAGAAVTGVITSGAQTIGGAKTFNGVITGAAGVTANGPGLTATIINGLTTGTSGNDFNITSAAGVHTFNLPSASAANRGVVTTGAQTFAGVKTFASAPVLTGFTQNSVVFIGATGELAQDNAGINFNPSTDQLTIAGPLVIGTTTSAAKVTIRTTSAVSGNAFFLENSALAVIIQAFNTGQIGLGGAPNLNYPVNVTGQLNVTNSIFCGNVMFTGTIRTPTNAVLAIQDTTGTVNVGSTTMISSSKFSVTSTTQGMRGPVMTTAQFAAIASKAQGLESYSSNDAGKLWFDGTGVAGFRYNRGTSKFQGYDGTNWIDLN